MKWFKYSSPQTFYPLAGRAVPWFMGIAGVLAIVGLYIAFFAAPIDFQQGDAYRIIFIHVPAAWMSMLIYTVMAFWAGIGLAFNTRLSSMMAHALAPTGALMTFIALWTGAFWGRPTWGAWWVWDARLTSFLILFLFYVGYMALQAAIDDEAKAARASGILALVGAVNLPIVHYSVVWWNSLHQGETIFVQGGPKAAPVYLLPLALMSFAYFAGFGALLMERVRAEIWRRRAGALAVQGAR